MMSVLESHVIWNNSMKNIKYIFIVLLLFLNPASLFAGNTAESANEKDDASQQEQQQEKNQTTTRNG